MSSAPYAAESVQFRDIVREADPGVDGDGHVTRRIGDEPRRTMIIPLA
jgi:hypothetical protein